MLDVQHYLQLDGSVCFINEPFSNWDPNLWFQTLEGLVFIPPENLNKGYRTQQIAVFEKDIPSGKLT